MIGCFQAARSGRCNHKSGVSGRDLEGMAKMRIKKPIGWPRLAFVLLRRGAAIRGGLADVANRARRYLLDVEATIAAQPLIRPAVGFRYLEACRGLMIAEFCWLILAVSFTPRPPGGAY